MSPTGHAALLYRGAVDYLAGVLPFLRDGVAAGAPTAVAVPPDNLAMLREECVAEGFADRVSWFDVAEVGGNPGRLVPRVLHPMLALGPARVVTELLWAGRRNESYPACVRHEALANRLLDTTDLRLLCPYDAERLPADSVADALLTHPGLLDGGAHRSNDGYAPNTALAAYNVAFAEAAGAATLSVRAPDLGAARALAARVAGEAGLDAGRSADISLVVTELATNGIEHGGGRATVSVWLTADDLVCEVRDQGVMSDPMAGLRPAPTDQPNGRGLLLVHSLADLVAVHTSDHGTAVRTWFRR